MHQAPAVASRRICARAAYWRSSYPSAPALRDLKSTNGACKVAYKRFFKVFRASLAEAGHAQYEERENRRFYIVEHKVSRREIITNLIDYLRSTYGKEYEPYGTWESEEEGTGFRITSVPATFSVLSIVDISENILNYQIESIPPGFYLHMGEATLDEFKNLIMEYLKPPKEWPAYDEESAQQGGGWRW